MNTGALNVGGLSERISRDQDVTPFGNYWLDNAYFHQGYKEWDIPMEPRRNPSSWSIKKPPVARSTNENLLMLLGIGVLVYIVVKT